MSTPSITPGGTGPIRDFTHFQFVDGSDIKDVHQSKLEVADRIDLNKDGVIADLELKDYLRKQDILRDPAKCNVDEEKIVQEFKDYLENKPLTQKKGYHSYDSTVSEMKDLAAKYPDLCKMESIGKSAEGRDIWALKITKGAQGDTSTKPGIMFTGVTHAREWITLEVPLYLSKGLLEGYGKDESIKKRLDNSEIWVLPMVNPDGYEYSRNENSWWRKNRRPITETGCETNYEGNICPLDKGQSKGTGVDLNRNFYDGNPEHYKYWRPDGDKPCDYSDDFSATSDDPRSDTYRGPEGASEIETKSIMDFELSRKNIKGVIDFHAYGEMILYPWGITYDPVENVDTYKDLGKKMNAAMGNSYRLMQSSSLYPTSGSSEEMHHLNKRLTFTIEMARSFQPYEKDIEPTCRKLFPACMTFIDHIIEHQKEIPWHDKPLK